MIAQGVSSFVALGDSFTEGLEDELGPDGRHTGWADRVAAGLAQVRGSVRYANLAVRGKILSQVIDEQIPLALDLSSDLISFHAGINDLLRPRADRRLILTGYTDGVKRLRASGAQVLLFTVVARTGGTGRTADALAARFAEFSEHVRQIGREHGCLIVDIAAAAALQDRRLWHEDRLHPAPEGHRRIAAAVLERLGVLDPAILDGVSGWWQQDLPPRARPARWAAMRADLYWARRYLLPWVGRRLRGASSGDEIRPKHPALIEIRSRR